MDRQGGNMDKFDFDSYCGIYCGACDIMMACKTGGRYRLAAFWSESLVRTLHRKLGIFDEKRIYEVKCNGCKSGTLFTNCAVCRIRECAIDRRVEHCIECPDYPCAMIVEGMKMKTLLPHLKENHGNMETVRNTGMEAWLSEQKKRWACPECGTAFSWYTGRCRSCGLSLKKKAYSFTFLQSIILKLAIRVFMKSRK
jgi:predicted RNA-binding Zn-ribbon protein involved in translation (DUF1610 family)